MDDLLFVAFFTPAAKDFNFPIQLWLYFRTGHVFNYASWKIPIQTMALSMSYYIPSMDDDLQLSYEKNQIILI